MFVLRKLPSSSCLKWSWWISDASEARDIWDVFACYCFVLPLNVLAGNNFFVTFSDLLKFVR